ncbi:MAG: hypothetical protein CL578_09380 [Alteromonadaceae bacterium]|nr:hypothetical protein [Alteromonadaceae bacterium]
MAIDLITKRHECSLLFYLTDFAILFVGMPQTLTPLFLLCQLILHWFTLFKFVINCFLINLTKSMGWVFGLKFAY